MQKHTEGGREESSTSESSSNGGEKMRRKQNKKTKEIQLFRKVVHILGLPLPGLE